MKPIASRDNPVFKSLRILARGSSRGDDPLAILEGVHLCAACLDAGLVPVQVVVGRSSFAHPEVATILARLPSLLTARAGYVFEDELYDTVSGVVQGVALLFVIEIPQVAVPTRVHVASVFLDRVQDPGNVGSILRSAAAAGVADVYASRECAGLWSSKVVRAGMGAHFQLRLFAGVDLVALRANTVIACLATSSHAPISIYETDLREPCVWMFGHEGRGLDDALMRDAIEVHIPQPGGGESLNVAAAAAVCFFEQVRQRTQAD